MRQNNHGSLSDPEQKGTLDKASRFPVVAIGTSAGGIQGLRTFFETIPSDTGAACYPATIDADVSEERLRRFFTRSGVRCAWPSGRS